MNARGVLLYTRTGSLAVTWIRLEKRWQYRSERWKGDVLTAKVVTWSRRMHPFATLREGFVRASEAKEKYEEKSTTKPDDHRRTSKQTHQSISCV